LQKIYSGWNVFIKISVNDKHTYLFKAEKYIFKQHADVIKGAVFLDLGVGGGRTTIHIWPLVSDYIGVDYSKEMINACLKKFKDKKNCSFHFADAAKLEFITDNTVDVALFSFNGIDYVDIAHRNRIMQEINRVLKPKGLFIFSFHNNYNLDKLYSYQWPKNPIKLLPELNRLRKLKEINGPKALFENKDWFCIFDSGENFNLNTMYLKPIFQQKLIAEANFENIAFYEATTGVKLEADTKSSTPWIYVTCSKKN
jgi:ubiquinone/menaquinone biosynthesis C-methylase UbiE